MHTFRLRKQNPYKKITKNTFFFQFYYLLSWLQIFTVAVKQFNFTGLPSNFVWQKGDKNVQNCPLTYCSIKMDLAAEIYLKKKALKFRYSEKTTKCWKISHFFLTLISTNFKKGGRLYQILWASYNIWTLHRVLALCYLWF